jgi:hypothetical protein
VGDRDWREGYASFLLLLGAGGSEQEDAKGVVAGPGADIEGFEWVLGTPKGSIHRIKKLAVMAWVPIQRHPS